MPQSLPQLLPLSIKTAKKVQFLETFSYGSLTDLAWSSDEKTIAVGSSRGIWLHEDLSRSPTQLQTVIRSVNSVDISPDCQLLASAEIDGAVRIWNLNTRNEIQTLSIGIATPMTVKFSPDGARLFVGCSDSTVQVWLLATMEPIRVLSCKVMLPSEYNDPYFRKISESITHLIISNDGKTLAAYGNGYTAIFLWDVDTYENKRVLNIAPSAQVIGLAFAREANLLLVQLHRDKLAFFDIWNSESGELEDSISIYLSNPQPNSKNNVWALQQVEGSATSQFVNTKTGQLLLHVLGTNDRVYNLDGTRLLRFNHLGFLERWDTATYQTLGSSAVSYQSMRGPIVFSPDSSLLAISNDSGVQVWDIKLGNIKATLRLPVGGRNGARRIWFDANNGLFLQGITHDNMLQIWNMSINELVKETQLPERVNHPLYAAIELSPNSKFLAYADEHRLNLWNFETQERQTIWQHADEIVKSVDYSPIGKYLAITTNRSDDFSINKTMHIFDMRDNKEILIIPSPAFKITFTPTEDVAFITSRKGDDVIQVWDLKKKSLRSVLPGLSPYIDKVKFDPSGELAIIGAKKSIDIWHWKKRKLIKRISLDDDEYFESLNISPDGKTIATVSGHSGELRIWGIPA